MTEGEYIERRESLASQEEFSTEGLSMLSIIRETLARQGKTSLSQRLIVCGQTQPGREPDITMVFQKFNKQNSSESEIITGFLMTKPSSWLHVIEAPAHVIKKVIRLLSIPTDNIHSSEIRILEFNEDLNERMFPVWIAKDVSTKNTKENTDERMYSEENLGETILNICDGILKIGKEISSVSQPELRVAIEDLADTYKDFFPSSNTLIELSTSEFILNLSDFVEFYDSKPKYHLERDVVWPVPRPLLSI